MYLRSAPLQKMPGAPRSITTRDRRVPRQLQSGLAQIPRGGDIEGVEALRPVDDQGAHAAVDLRPDVRRGTPRARSADARHRLALGLGEEPPAQPGVEDDASLLLGDAGPDHRRAASERVAHRARPAPGPAPRAGRPSTAFPSLATCSGSIPRISEAARTSSESGTACSERRTPTPLFSAISCSALASPPRVGSFIATTPSPPARSTWRISPFSGATSERRLPCSSSFWRAASTAKPWSPMVPVTTIRSPGRSPLSRTSRSVIATPVVLSTRPSSSPRPITLVSPVTTGALASREASRIEAWIRCSSSMGKPSSMTTAQVSPSTSVAPIIERSFTVPQIDSRPTSPPGKKRGATTCESVVSTSQPPLIGKAAPSSISASPTEPGGCWAPSAKSCSMSARIARPPAPCLRLTVVPSGRCGPHGVTSAPTPRS